MADGQEFSVAVVGVACRVPGAGDCQSFFDNLRRGKESIDFFTEAQLEANFHLRDHPRFVRAWGVLEGVEEFDPDAFGLSSHEALRMDPQHRQFLSCAFDALVDAGLVDSAIPSRGVSRRCEGFSVYAGQSPSAYLGAAVSHAGAASEAFSALYHAHADYLPTLVAHRFDLHGEAVAVQTACSTSLVAVHLACQSILLGQSSGALVGGVSLFWPQRAGYLYQPGLFLSKDGHTRAFDQGASGTCFGSGVGVVVLRRLNDALADGDRIYAVIRGSAINNDGSAKVGYSAPSVDGQARVIADALVAADVEAEEVSYVETHGTGTALGDPIEVSALALAHGKARSSCYLGALKPNIGHLSEAAGVVALIKVVRCLQERELVPTINFETPSREIKLEETRFSVNDRLRSWESPRGRRIAGVSAFGIGGTNAHVILEEAPPEARRTGSPVVARLSPRRLCLMERPPSSELAYGNGLLCADRHFGEHELLLTTADTDDSLRSRAVAAARSFRSESVRWSLRSAVALANAMAGQGPRRLAVVGGTAEQFSSALSSYVATGAGPGLVGRGVERRGRVAFVFTGQGAVHPHMGRRLRASDPRFAAELGACDDALRSHLGASVIERALAVRDPSEFRDPVLSQCASFAVGVALARWLLAHGVELVGCVGHSLGEVAAAHIAGALCLEDAARVVVARSQGMQRFAPRGATVAIQMGAEAAEDRLAKWKGRLAVACDNGPTSAVVAGEEAAAEALLADLRGEGVRARKLDVGFAFHTEQMDGVLAPFLALVDGIGSSDPSIEFYSSSQGRRISRGEEFGANYWATNIRERVKFRPAVELMLEAGIDTFVEIGPHPLLCSSLSDTARRLSRDHTLVLSTLEQGVDDREAVCVTLGRLFVGGADICWPGTTDEASEEDVTPQRADLGDTVRSLLEQAVGRPLEATDLERSMVELGLDSVALLTFCHRLERTVGVELSLEEVVHRCCADLIRGASVAEPAAAPKKSRLLHLTKGGGAKPSVVFFPGAGGTALMMAPWATSTVIGDRNAYVFDPPGHGHDRDAPLSAMEDVLALARSGLDQLGVTSPLLVGYSFGGMVAYALARSLIEDGRDVSGVVLAHTLPPDAWQRRGASRQAGFEALFTELFEESGLEGVSADAYVASARADFEAAESLASPVRLPLRAALLFSPSDPYAPADQLESWHALFEEVRMHQAAGGHFDFASYPQNLDLLGNVISGFDAD